jgi:excinuclease ABC subunit B
MQTIGRAARNVNAKVILYADRVTEAMQRTMDETARRRALQEAYNKEHGITPETIKKAIFAGIEAEANAHAEANAKVGMTDETKYITEEYIAELEAEMYAAAEAMEFERAAIIRDRIGQMRDQIGKPVAVLREGDDGQTRKRRGAKRKTGDPAAWKGRVPRPKRNV